MQQPNVIRIIVAGVAATAVMTVLMMMGPVMGMPEMNIGKMLGGFMGIGDSLGWVAHFMIGTVLGFIYVYVFLGKLPGAPWLKGAIYGLIPWLISQVMVNPMMGAGVFASNMPDPMMMVMGSFMGHVVYGAVLGAVYGPGLKEQAAPAQA